MCEKKILIVAGEASGDMYGAQLVRSIQQATVDPIFFFGCAGKAMREAGVNAAARIEEVSVHGIVEVFFHLEYVFDGFLKLLRAADRYQPDLAILIDFPEFNMRLAAHLRRLGIRIVYFISPQFWAWRRGRVKLLRGLIEEMICILPFEEAFYRQYGIPAEYVGHPLIEILDSEAYEHEANWPAGLDPSRPSVALLPGSRRNEVRYNLPPLLETLARIQPQRPELQFALAASPTVGSEYIGALIEQWQASRSVRVALTVVENKTHSVLRHSRAAIVSSGTATLEAALLGTPLVSVYKVAPLSWWIGQKLVDVDYYCLVNLVLNREVVPELYQSDYCVERLERELFRLLDDEEARQAMLREFRALRQVLGTERSPLTRSAEIVLRHLGNPKAKD